MPTQPAIVGTARVGNFRLGYVPAALAAIRRTKVRIVIAGTDVRARVQGLSIHTPEGASPSTASLVIDSPAPTSGQSIRIFLNADAPQLLFSGAIQQDDLTYEGKPTQLVYPCRAIDDTAELTRRRPFGTWVNTSVTTIAQSIIADYAPGFTSTYVDVSLPTVSIIFDGTDDFPACLRRLARAVGGYFYIEDFHIHLFTSEATDAPDPIQSGYPFCDDPPITVTRDVSQLRTKQTGKGHGEKVPVDVAAGETIIPIDDAVMFNPLGGRAIAGTTPDGAQSQLLTYTGTIQRGAGSMVGPSLSPNVAPVLALGIGAGVDTGPHAYAYTFSTLAGETTPSPLGTITTLQFLAAPAAAFSMYVPPAGSGFGGFLTNGANYSFVYTFSTATSSTDHSQETTPSPASVAAQPLNGTLGFQVTLPIDPLVTWVFVYRTLANGSTYHLTQTVLPVNFSPANPPTAWILDHHSDASIAGEPTPPVSNTTPVRQQVAVSGIATGPVGTTSRKVYRTAAGGSQLKLLQSVADNSTTNITDTAADSSLGANAPTTNTSALSVAATTGGGFYTASPVTFATNGAATSANTASPVFSSASYTFVAADVGARLYIKTGTNWTPGSYAIVSVAAGAATVAGPIASVASPTSGTWGVDYSAFTTPRVSFSDLVIDATTSTKFTSAAFPVGPHYIGNVLAVSNSLGFIEQQVVVLSVSGTVATCDKVLGTLSSTGGAGVLGVAPLQPFVVAGSSTLVTASAGPFSASGGWVGVGQQIVRYTGVSGNVLTGIPPIGTVGALIETVGFGEHIYVVPALVGVTGLALPMLRGTPVHIWVERNDLAAQAAQAAIDAANGRVRADGIYEGPPIVDERRGEDSLIALCDATLVLFSTPIVTVTYATRDVKTKSGKPIVVNLASPPVSQTLTILDVTIDQIDIAPRLAPKFTVTASTWRPSLEAVLQRMIAATGV